MLPTRWPAAWLSLALALAASPHALLAREAPARAAAASAAKAPQADKALQRTAEQQRDTFALMEAWLAAQTAYDRLPSLSAGVVLDDRLAWHKAWGYVDQDKRQPASNDSVYSICSVSKLLTSVAVMQLWEQGKLSLDDDIGKLVKDFAITRHDKDSGPITVRSLLTHAAGVPRELGASYWMDPEGHFPNRQELYAALAKQHTERRVNDKFAYSNLGMSLLGDVVAQVSGQPYEAYIRQHILEPLQMNSTVLMPAAGLPPGRLATGFSTLPRSGERAPMPLFDTQAIAGAAGYAASVADLARFAGWQLRLLQDGGQELLKVATLREMQRPQWVDPDGKLMWGLGFAVHHEGPQVVVGHDGQCPGHRASLELVPKERWAVVSQTNTFGRLGWDGDSLYAKGMRGLLAKGFALDHKAKEGEPKPRSPLADYSGRYDFVGDTLFLPWGTGLVMLRVPSANPADEMTVLASAGGDRFTLLEADGTATPETVEFYRDALGKIAGVLLWSQRAPRLGPVPR